jgi:hypothetical protein
MEATPESQLPALPRMTAKAAAAARLAAPLTAALALRLWMLKALFHANGDTLVYGNLAKNLLLHGRYALSAPGEAIHSTLIRLPGYPLFLAACFRLFGVENYFAAACVQIALDLVACLLLADFSRRIAPPAWKRRAALATLWLAALCPFTASYAADPLPESLTVFLIALALWALARFHGSPDSAVADSIPTNEQAAFPPKRSLPWGEGPNWGNALCFTFAVTGASLLRPDGAIAAVAFAPAMVLGWPRGHLPMAMPRQKLLRMTLVCALLALAPFAAWGWRNWRVFHVFQPLAPRSALDPGENPQNGWNRWVKTWCLDFVSTFEIYWNVPGGELDVSQLPSRAFDSPAQHAETAALAREYNHDAGQLTPTINARFKRLAEQRIAAHPWRYYLFLPLGRLADMWLRPRVEVMDIDQHWWAYARHPVETCLCWAYAGLNAFYLLLGLAGLWLRPRFWAAMLAYMVLRSALLLTVAAPETRYTLECFPMLFALGGIAIAAAIDRHRRRSLAG